MSRRFDHSRNNATIRGRREHDYLGEYRREKGIQDAADKWLASRKPATGSKEHGAIGNKPFNEGVAARQAGRPASSNPYRLHTTKAVHWLQGWQKTETEDG